MHELLKKFPDAEVLLLLGPHELAAEVLSILCERARSTRTAITFLPYNETLNFGGGHPGQPQYPPHIVNDARLALSEAFSVLQSSSLIVASPGSDNWLTLSRRAKLVESAEQAKRLLDSTILPKETLHEALRGEAWLSFMRGDYSTAVFQAMRSVEVSIRQAANLPNSDYGVTLARKAFKKGTGPLTDPSAEESEQEALSNLVSGALGSYKNPHSHRHIPLDDANEAQEILLLASHILRIVDARRKP